MNSQEEDAEIRVPLTVDEHDIINGLTELSESNAEWYKDCHVAYQLPLIRFSTIFWAILLLDAVCTNALWLAGWSSQLFFALIIC